MPLSVDILTIFPGMFTGVLQESILGRAIASGLLTVRLTNLRDFATDRHRSVDDRPYGGGPGMVFKPEPAFAAIESVLARTAPLGFEASLGSGAQGEGEADGGRRPVDGEGCLSDAPRCWPAGQGRLPAGHRRIILSPQGRPLSQSDLRALAGATSIVLLCGHYEGFDERIVEGLRRQHEFEELSVGDYVLSGGELPAMLILDGVARLLPGALGHPDSATEESFEAGILDCPHYTRPPVFRGMAVPEVLLSGNHQEIARWRREQALERTRERRQDLLDARQSGGESGARPVKASCSGTR